MKIDYLIKEWALVYIVHSTSLDRSVVLMLSQDKSDRTGHSEKIDTSPIHIHNNSMAR